jgi:hypothetical protein
MTHFGLVVALGMSAAMLPPAGYPGAAGAPAGDPATKYCLRVDPPTGSRIETIRCMTRDEWAQLDVDVDAEWAENGVRVIT